MDLAKSCNMENLARSCKLVARPPSLSVIQLSYSSVPLQLNWTKTIEIFLKTISSPESIIWSARKAETYGEESLGSIDSFYLNHDPRG